LLFPLKVQQLVPIVLLDGYPLPSFEVHTLFHLSIGSSADQLAEAVLFYPGAVRGAELAVCVVVFLVTENVLGLLREKFI
jgi:hypothetical protein